MTRSKLKKIIEKQEKQAKQQKQYCKKAIRFPVPELKTYITFWRIVPILKPIKGKKKKW